MGPWARLAAACAACPLQWQTDVYWKVNEQSGPSSAAAGGPKYCGTSWPALQGNCETATECRSGSDADCPTGQKCFGDVECRKKSPATRPPTRPPTRYPTRQTSSAAYSKPPMRPPTTRPVSPAGDIIAEVVGGTHNAVAARPPTDQPVMIWADNGPEEEGGGPAGRPTVDDPSETQWRLTNDLYLHGILRASYYCGARFRFDASTCATARPCPAGHHGDCPEGEHCFPDTPCGDLIDGGGGGGDVAADDSAPSPSGGQRLADGVPGQFTSTCTSNDHCPFGQFCAASLADGSGSCRSCLVGSGMGCSTDEFCRTRTCSDETEGEERCYSRDELDLGCRVAGPGKVCDIESMECVEGGGWAVGSPSTSGDTLAPVPPTGRPTGRPTRIKESLKTSAYENPEDNGYFCGDTYSQVISQCLASKPCAGGVSFGVCGENQGCFYAPVCAQEYELASTQPVTQSMEPLHEIGTKPNDVEPTCALQKRDRNYPTAKPMIQPVAPNVRSRLPSNKPTRAPNSVGPSSSPSNEPTRVPNSFGPSSSPMINTNYCGSSWSEVNNLDGCSRSTPCPTGNECPAGQICFTGSPCAALLRPALEQEEQIPSNVGSYCGSSWNALLVDCESARLCPQGNECGDGELCYRNFVCNPPETLTPTKKITPAPSAVVTHKFMAEKPASTDLHQNLNQEENLSSNTASSYDREYIVKETVGGLEASTQSPTSSSARAEATTVSTSSSGITPSPHQVSEFPTCSLCGDASVNSNSISFNGRPYPCDVFQDVFELNAIHDGSELCLNFRQEYSSSCCTGQSSDTHESHDTEAVPDTQQSPVRSPGVSDTNRLGGSLVKSPRPTLTSFDVGSWYSAHNGSSPLRSGDLIVTIAMGYLCHLLAFR